jgi:hypothetical protein
MGKVDLTVVAVKRQLKTMACETFEVGIYNRADDVMMNRTWNSETIIKYVNFLKSKNKTGHDIYIRPVGSMGLVFFDDLNQEKLARLRADGLTPAVIIRSSPQSYHGWIKVSADRLDTKLATAVAKVLAIKYGGDVNSADWRHYGRLAGFTNRKLQYIDDEGKHPYAILYEYKGAVAENATQLLEEAHDYLRIKAEEADARRQAIMAARESRIGNDLRPAEDFYLSELKGLLTRYKADFNRSKADWMIVLKMLELGYHESEVAVAMLEHSPKVHAVADHASKYIEITLKEAMGEIGIE